MKIVNVVAGIIIKDNRILSAQRGYGEFKGKWEFPGGKIENGEAEETALKRELMEELGILVEVGRAIGNVEYDYETFHLNMSCYICRILDGEIKLMEHKACQWLEVTDLRRVDWLPADINVVELLERFI